MKSIIKSFSEHGTFVQHDTLDYILSKENPEDFTTFITKNLKEYPLVLTLDHVKDIEQLSTIKEETNEVSNNFFEKKEIQTKMLSNIYSDNFRVKTDDDLDLEYDDPDKDDQISLPDENVDEIQKPDLIEIKKVKGWKPKSKDYNPEIKILKDVTGNSTCEGTTNDFTKLFLDRFDVLRKILRSQRREIANAIPINRIKRNNMREIQLVGIIKDIRTTKNGHRLIEIEDDTGTAASGTPGCSSR